MKIDAIVIIVKIGMSCLVSQDSSMIIDTCACNAHSRTKSSQAKPKHYFAFVFNYNLSDNKM